MATVTRESVEEKAAAAGGPGRRRRGPGGVQAGFRRRDDSGLLTVWAGALCESGAEPMGGPRWGPSKAGPGASSAAGPGAEQGAERGDSPAEFGGRKGLVLAVLDLKSIFQVGERRQRGLLLTSCVILKKSRHLSGPQVCGKD